MIQSRVAESSDLTAIRKLAIDSFTHAYARFNTEANMQKYLAENFSEEKLLEEIHARQILIGLRDEKIVAYAKLTEPDASKIPGRKPLEISRLYTDVSLIGQRIGTCMINHIANEAYDRGCDSICLDVWQKNYRAVNFYQREGFKIVGTTRFILGDDVQDDFVMLKKSEDDEVILETERLIMRKFNPKRDGNYFFRLVNSPGWLKHIGDRKVYSDADGEAYIRNRIMKSYAESGFAGYVMVEKSTGLSIGNSGLFKRPVLDSPDIGYALLPEAEGKGYALEASLAVVAQARKLGLKKLYGITVDYNTRSIRLLEKLGLRLEKKFRMPGPTDGQSGGEGDPEELSLYSMDL